MKVQIKCIFSRLSIESLFSDRTCFSSKKSEYDRSNEC